MEGLRISLKMQEVFADLRRQLVEYCILRNFGRIDLNEGDVDILVTAAELGKVHKILASHGFKKIMGDTIPGHHQYMSYENPRKIIKIDLSVDSVCFMGIAHTNGSCILKRKIQTNSFCVPSQEDLFIGLVLHSIIDKAYFKDTYIETLNKISNTPTFDKSYVEFILTDLFGNKTTRIIWRYFKLQNFSELVKLRKKLLIRLLLKDTGNLYRFIKTLTCRFLNIRKINPFANMVISFIGVDGSGKTTTAKNLFEFMVNNGVLVKYVYMGLMRQSFRESHLIKILSEFYRRNGYMRDDTQFRQVKKSSKILHILVDLFYISVFTWRYLFHILPYRIRGYCILTDRYPYDRLTNEYCSCIAGLFFMKIFPKPTFSFYLHTDANTATTRKKEYTLRETKENIFRYNKFIQTYGNMINCHLVIGTKSQEDILASIMEKIWSNCSSSYFGK